MLRFLSLFLLTGLTLLTGCMVGPDYVGPPCPPTPKEWTQNDHKEVRPENPAIDDWWMVFDDPVLNTILTAVNEQNLSLRSAAWKVYQARAALCATQGQLFPAIGTDASYSYVKMSGDNKPRGTDLFASTWDWGVSANWELDVFGQIKRYIEAQEAEVEATEDDYRNVKMVLMADTARTYIDARLYQERMEIVRANILQQREFLRIIVARFTKGKDSRLDYSQAVANLAAVEASYPSIMSGYRESLNRLSVLMGCPPGTVDELMKKVEPLPVAPDAVAVSIPADILRRRPDIRAMERRLAAQNARIGVAMAERYPKFYINGSFGLEADRLDDLFNARSFTASVMPSLSWRLLEFGRIRCTIMQQEGLTEQMKYDYQETVLEAAEEVDNAISNYVRLQQRVEYLEETVVRYRQALQLSEQLYSAGRNNYLPVLDSQRYVLEYEELLAVARANLATSVVQIYKALGGGWQVDPVSAGTGQQIDRFRNRYAGEAPTSRPGESVNTNGPLASRHDLPVEVAKSSSRQSLSTTRATLTEEQKANLATTSESPQQGTESMKEIQSAKNLNQQYPLDLQPENTPTTRLPKKAPSVVIPPTEAPKSQPDPLLEGLRK
ncbi:MAG: efflux transporter outer membrane subunit [Planctomycetia bacterium]|nr:efflux transporter outer membrane subunit [Planctomycetia bacterium]